MSYLDPFYMTKIKVRSAVGICNLFTSNVVKLAPCCRCQKISLFHLSVGLFKILYNIFNNVCSWL